MSEAAPVIEPDSKNPAQPEPGQTDQTSTDNKYAILMETNGLEYESWYTFIRWSGNEEALRFLNQQLSSVDWEIIDDYSTFDLEIDHLVSESTAKDMIRVDLNHYSFHRKFDGKMKRIDFKLKSTDKTSKKIRKIFDVLGFGQIEDYLDGEEVLEDSNPDRKSSSSESGSESSDGSSSESSDSSDSSDKKKPEKKRTGIPPALLKSNLPGFAKGKQHRKKH